MSPLACEQAAVAAQDAMAIGAVIAEFHYRIDHGRASECAVLFCDDARMTFGPGSPKPGTLEGLDTIRSFLSARQAMAHVTTRHVLTNLRFASNGSDSIAAAAIMTLYRSEDDKRQPDVVFVADLDEVYARAADGRWLIRERTITPIFARS